MVPKIHQAAISYPFKKNFLMNGKSNGLGLIFHSLKVFSYSLCLYFLFPIATILWHNKEVSYKLVETSALVLLCDKGVSYQTPLSKKFLSSLDTSAGESIYNCYSDYFSEISRIITNRKYITHKFCSQFLKRHGSSAQLIFLACGWDPVLIKMQELFPKNKIFGIDSQVKEPEELTKKILPISSISYLKADITDSKEWLKDLVQKGWNPSHPTGLVIEGITYYIPPSLFWKNISPLKKACSSSFSICGDFLVPLNKKYVSEKGLKMGQLIFETIKNKCQIENYYNYSQEDINERILSLGFSSLSLTNFEDVELERFGVCKNWNEKDCYLHFFSTHV